MLASQYAGNRYAHPDVVSALQRTAELSRSSRVLEVGCGTGNYIAALRALTGCFCWGIDPSEAMLGYARKRPDTGDLTFSPGAAERLDFPDDSFHLVFSVDVIHHLADRDAFFREVARVLCTRGSLCTVTESEPQLGRSRPQPVLARNRCRRASTLSKFE